MPGGGGHQTWKIQVGLKGWRTRVCPSKTPAPQPAYPGVRLQSYATLQGLRGASQTHPVAGVSQCSTSTQVPGPNPEALHAEGGACPRLPRAKAGSKPQLAFKVKVSRAQKPSAVDRMNHAP